MNAQLTIHKLAYKETEFGFLPKEWNIVSIEDKFDVRQGKQLSSKETTEGKIKKPFLRTSNVFWDRIDLSILDYMYFTQNDCSLG